MLETCLQYLPEEVMESIVGDKPVRDDAAAASGGEPFDVQYEVFGPGRGPMERHPIGSFDESKSPDPADPVSPTTPPTVHLKNQSKV